MEISLKALNDARDRYTRIIDDLKGRFMENNLLYMEKNSLGEGRRPIFIVKNQKELDDIKSTLATLGGLTADINAMAGYTVRLHLPALHEGVLLYRIWPNTTNVSSTVNTSRKDIIDRLKRRIDAVERNLSPSNEATLEQLITELRFFENETEDTYRARSKGHPVTYLGLSQIHGMDKKVKTIEAGNFIVGVNFDTPVGDIPNGENRKKRKARISIFDELTPVEYSGATNVLLYRESEVEARKKAIGFTAAKQKEVADQHKNKTKKRQ